MILITGGAGFIGSNLQAALARRGHETVVVDNLGTGEKWRNLAKHPPSRLLPPSEIDSILDGRTPLEMIYHLGAITDTTVRDGDAAWAINVELSRHIWDWCANHGVRLVYASSAATYGDGSAGFADDISPDFDWQKKVGLKSSRFGPAPDQPTHDNWGPFVVPQAHVFTLGDNRYDSKDARYYGFVPRANVWGRPMFCYFSIDTDSWSIRWSRIGHTFH